MLVQKLINLFSTLFYDSHCSCIINNPNLENSFDFKLNYNKSARFNFYWLPHPLSSLSMNPSMKKTL